MKVISNDTTSKTPSIYLFMISSDFNNKLYDNVKKRNYLNVNYYL
jgi:hypothetical protein